MRPWGLEMLSEAVPPVVVSLKESRSLSHRSLQTPDAYLGSQHLGGEGRQGQPWPLSELK